MLNAHDVIVLAKHDPCGLLICPNCKENFVGETGIPQLAKYKVDDDPDWTVGILIFCSQLCCLAAKHNVERRNP
jgi:hypothetical protein